MLIRTILVVLLFAIPAYPQAWSGILAPTRAIDWTQAGVVGGIPSANWTQCGSTIAAGSSAATIQAAINACGANQFVLLGPGSFSLSTFLSMKSNMVLRGSGATQTIVTFGSNAFGGCFLGGSSICFTLDNRTYSNSPNIQPGGTNSATWTAGFSQGATSITLTNVGSTGIINGEYIFLDQVNDTTIGSGLFICDTTTCSTEGLSPGRIINGVGYSQVQAVKVISGCATTCTGAGPFNLTITPGIYGTNWSSSKTPGAWFPSAELVNSGVENMTIDNQTGSGDNASTINFLNAFNCWVSGLKTLHGGRAHVWLFDAAHITVQNNYMYQTQNGQSQSYGVEEDLSSDNLVVNNIFQQITAPLIAGSQFGNSFAYNYSINNYQTLSVNCMFFVNQAHDAASEYNLYEGNVFNGNDLDDVHGTSGLNTMFRNVFSGYELTRTCSTVSIFIDPYNRYENIVGNVLGTPGRTTWYDDYSNPTQGANEEFMVYILNQPHASIAADAVVAQTLLRWANYDSVTGAVRFCGNSSDTGWATTCHSTSEVPTSVSGYPNSVPTLGDTVAGQGAMPASFIYASTPSWWPSGKPWPPIGPDVSNGSVGQCSGGTYPTLFALSSSQCTGGTFTANVNAGHAYSVPAMDCYFNVMGGPPDGSGNALTFNPSTCYSSGSTPQAATPVCTPTGGNVTQLSLSVSCTNPSSAPVECSTQDGTTPVTNGATGCTIGSVVSGGIAVTPVISGVTLKVVAGGTGFTDSVVASNTYTLTFVSPPATMFAGYSIQQGTVTLP